MAITFKNNNDKESTNDLTSKSLQTIQDDEAQEKSSKTKSKLLKVLLIFEIIALCAISLYVLLPVLTFLRVMFFSIALMLFFCVLVCITIVTVGLIWFSEEARANVSGIMDGILRGFNGIGDAATFLSSIKVYVLTICSVIVLCSLITSIVKYKKNAGFKSYFVTNVVLSSIYLVIFVIVLLAYSGILTNYV